MSDSILSVIPTDPRCRSLPALIVDAAGAVASQYLPQCLITDFGDGGE